MNRKISAAIITFFMVLAMTTYAYANKLGPIHAKRAAADDVIYVSAAVEGDILDLLGRDREVVTFDNEVPRPLILGHVVVTAADLAKPNVVWLLTEAYSAGRTVAIIDATKAEADRFHRLFGAASEANCEPANGAETIELYGLQVSIARRPRLFSSYCLSGVKGPRKRGLRDWRARRDLQDWLQERFARSAPEPRVADPGDDESGNIVDMATATHCSFNTTSDPTTQGRGMKVDTYVTGARSFSNQEDIYYVQNDLQYYSGTSSNPNVAFAVLRVGATGVTQFEEGESEPQPDSVNSYVSSITNSTTTTISGSVGFNAMGPTGTVGGSVSHGKSVTVTVPPITISNNTTISPPLPQWTFHKQSTPSNQNFTPGTSWFWTIPKSAYAYDMGEGVNGALSFRYFFSMGGDFNDPTSGDFVAENTCNVSYPFGGLWEDQVGNPQISTLSPTTVELGQSFTITGTELYPGLVTAVFIEGTAIDPKNVMPKGESSPGSGIFTVNVIVPSETNGSPTPTGTVSIAIETTFNDAQSASNTMPLTITAPSSSGP